MFSAIEYPEKLISTSSQRKKKPRHDRRGSLPLLLLLHLKLGVDHVLLAFALGMAIACRSRFGAAAARLLALAIEVLGHGVRSLLELADRLLDGVDVVLARRLLDLLDGGLDRPLVRIGDL